MNQIIESYKKKRVFKPSVEKKNQNIGYMDWKKIYKKINIYIEREKLIRLKNEMEEKLYNVIIILRNTNNVFFLIYVLIRILS